MQLLPLERKLKFRHLKFSKSLITLVISFHKSFYKYLLHIIIPNTINPSSLLALFPDMHPKKLINEILLRLSTRWILLRHQQEPEIFRGKYGLLPDRAPSWTDAERQAPAMFPILHKATEEAMRAASWCTAALILSLLMLTHIYALPRCIKLPTWFPSKKKEASNT
jgi:hypothetical protein